MMLKDINDLPPELLCSILDCFARPDGSAGFEHRNAWDYFRPKFDLYRGQEEEDAAAKQILMNVSLVSHTWHEIALPLLFRTLVLRFSPSDAQVGRTLEGVSSMLQAAPAVCASVTHLRLVMSAPTGRTSRPKDDLQNSDFLLLLSILQRFPRLRSLQMQDVTVKTDDLPGPGSFPTNFLHLDRFTYLVAFRNPFDIGLADVFPILSLLGDVNTVAIARVWGIAGSQDSLPCVSDGLCIRSLELSAVTSLQALVRSLTATATFRLCSLRSLSMSLNCMGGVANEEDVQAFLAEVAPNLEELQCNAGWFMHRKSRLFAIIHPRKI